MFLPSRFLSLFLSIIICLLHTILNYIPACISLFVWDFWNLEMGNLSCCFLLFVFWVEFEMLMESVRREEERKIPALFENWKGEKGREGPLLITSPWDCSFASLIHFLVVLWIVTLAYQNPLYSISQSIAASCPPLLSFSLLNTNPNVFGPWPMTHH
jgi:hypothetical protein